MRIYALFGVLAGMAVTAAAFAGDTTTKMMDDFTAQMSTMAWQARPDATMTHEKDGLRLSMPKYTGQKGEGQWPGMERSAAGLPFAEYNGILIDVTNATDRRQPLGVGFNDGTSAASMFQEIGPRERRTVKIHFDRMSSGTADWSNIQRITVSWTTPSRPMVWVFHKIEFFRDDPATTELGQLRGLVNKAQEAFKQAQTAGALSDKQKSHAQEIIAKWTKAVQTSAGIAGKDADCRNELGSLQSDLRLASLPKQVGKPMVAWSVPLGTRFEPGSAILQYQKPLDKLQLHGAKGQYADNIVRITNLSDADQDWQVSVESKDSGIVPAITLRRNQSILAADRSVVGDALTPLDAAGVLSVAPHQTVELWVRADLKHHEWKPGTHEAELSFKNLRRGIASIQKLPLEITAWNFNLADAPVMHLNTWASLYWPNAAMLTGREQAALENLDDYGCDVLTINPGQFPWPKLNAAGESTAPMDFTQFDTLVKLYQTRGKPITLIWLGLDDTHPDMQQLQSHLAVHSPAWEKGMHWWLGQLMERMKQLNVPTSRYALYVTDEPNEAELDLTKVVAGIAKSIDPSVQIYMDSSELYQDQKQNDELMRVVDINQPNGDAMDARSDLLPSLKKYPKCELWMYQCRTSTRARQLVNAYDYYRLQAWLAQKNGMNGIGFWVYAYNAQKDVWDGTTSSGSGEGMVYPDSGNGLLMSVRWELVRTGLDDVKYYRLLQKAPGTPAIEALLGKRFDEVLAHPHNPELAVQWRIDAGKAIAGK
jgi:hypothetical protein